MKHKAVGIINSSVAIKASRIGAIAMNAAAVVGTCKSPRNSVTLRIFNTG